MKENSSFKRKAKRTLKSIFRPLDVIYLRRKAGDVLLALFAMCMTAFLFYHLADMFTADYETVGAVSAQVNRSIRTEAYIMRTEIPVYSKTGGGSVSASVKDGSKVSAYSEIAEIFSEDVPDTESRLDEIEEQIDLIEKNLDDEHTVKSSGGLDDSIYSSVAQIVDLCGDGNYRNALAMKTTLLLNIRKRSIIVGDSNNSDVLEALRTERDAIRSELGSCLEIVYSPDSGYYYSEYDGYGDVFSASLIDEMTWEDYDNMINASPEYGNGICVGTLVSDYEWYVAAKMDKSDAAALEQYDNSVYFGYSDMTISMGLYRVITKVGENEAVVILSGSTMPTGFDFTRCQPITVYTDSFEGYEIPIEAVRVLDGNTGVYVIEKATVGFRRINVIYETDTSVICSNEDETGYIRITKENDEADESDNKSTEYEYLRHNDTIIVGGRKLKVGKTLS